VYKNPDATISGDYQYQALQRGPRIQRFWHRNKLNVMRQVLPISSAEIVVDVGCGSGNLIFQSRQPAQLAIGLDMSEAAVRFCQSLIPEGGRSHVLAQAMGHAIPLSNACTDTVLLVEVIEHLPAPLAVLSEIRRIMKDGARLFITTPNYAFPSLWPLLEALADRSGLVPKMASEQHIQQFGPEMLADLLKQAGFNIGCLGTFYRFSPFASLISEAWADSLVSKEVASGQYSGSLIYCVARKPRG